MELRHKRRHNNNNNNKRDNNKYNRNCWWKEPREELEDADATLRDEHFSMAIGISCLKVASRRRWGREEGSLRPWSKMKWHDVLLLSRIRIRIRNWIWIRNKNRKTQRERFLWMKSRTAQGKRQGVGGVRGGTARAVEAVDVATPWRRRGRRCGRRLGRRRRLQGD